MKQKIIEFFHELPSSKHEQFNKLFEFYRDSPGKGLAIERSVNAVGYSKENFDLLKYELQKLYGIKDVELIAKEKKEIFVSEPSLSDKIYQLFQGIVPIVVPTEEEKIDADNWDQAKLEQCFVNVLSISRISFAEILDRAKQQLPEFVDTLVKAHEYLANQFSGVSGDLSKQLEIVSGEKENLESDLDDALNEKNDLEEENEALKEAKEQVEQELSELKKSEKEHAQGLRDEFPFLNEKDCPDIAHVLVGRKIAAWKRYQASHLKLQLDIDGTEKLPEEEKLSLAKSSVEDFTENQSIYDELNHYKENKEFLNKHSLFKTVRLQKEVESMSPDDLIAFKGSSAKYFSVKKQKLKNTNTTEEEVLEINKGIEERREKLDLVNKKLGVVKK